MRKRNMAAGASRLLERIEYARRPPEDCVDLCGVMTITVRDAFPYDPSSRTAPTSAMRWADRGNRATPADIILSRSNEPFEVRITDMTVRDHGGRAYKVVTHDGLRLDLREDQLIEAIARVDIAPGGAIQGEFAWGIADKQLCLVLVGGEVHAAMVKGTRGIREEEQRRASGEG